MRLRTGIVDIGTPELVLVPPNRRVGYSSVGLPELGGRNARQFGPVRRRGVDVESLMQIDPTSEARLIDLEEASEPRAEERDHCGIAVCESHCAVSLRAFPCVERDACGQERGVAQRADALDTFEV